ncbi:penicillin-binding transpeptidase domain-containing protein [Oceanobacillus halophilus]|uniref:serine-type D-Ala-D-Ala carboxypeptidase n=1 Tax=Oceanobacillus halophilus TaxID=930130 RepID=A0A495ACT2_9BACI|nr:penicillin-binding transpeptidase domain-containing protein [Oceanobacillus halophilus]RKQ37394.1 PASTA domain-containing protein [Oceanobacillus halophilus]
MRKSKTTHFMSAVLILFFSTVFIILTGRYMYIQATGEIDGISLEEFAKEKRTSSYTINSERGKIYDNNGMTLAYDMPVYKMYAIVREEYSENLDKPKHVVDPKKTAEALAPILEVEESVILERIEEGIESDRFQVEFGKAGNQISQQDKEQIEKLNLPGINFQEDSLRNYPNGTFASHIIGFARNEEKELEDGTIIEEITGIAGIENEMNELLKGKDGYISYQRDKYNDRLLNPNEIITEPEDGDDVYLTIDQKIQTLVEDVLSQVEEEYNPERMTAVVMNPKTGEVLAMGNRPSYNPNNPANVENWYNDVISTPFEPGSTVKIFTWAAAIEEGVYNGEEGYKTGSYQVNEQISPIHDHNGGKGWGTISYDEGFSRSSNVAAAKLAWEKIGTEKYFDYLQAFDLDEKSDIDLPGEVAGEILYNWPLEKITTSFGQGSTMTPMQQIKAVSAIANKGKMVQPYVIEKIVDSTTGEIIEEKSPNIVGQPISEDTANHVLALMESVVVGEHGTGKKFKLEDYTTGGKTGTAEIPNPNGGGYLTGRNNYIFSFLGAAPIDDPQLVMYVSVKQPKLENYEVGSDPVSFIYRNVMENSLHYLDINPDKEQENESTVFEIPEIMEKDTSQVVHQFAENDLNVTVIGEGEKIVKANVKEGDTVIPHERIILVTDKPTMPNVIGWSIRDVLQLADLTNLKLETFGNGYVISQNIKEGAAIKENDYVAIELIPPGEETSGENDEDEAGNIEDMENNSND